MLTQNIKNGFGIAIQRPEIHEFDDIGEKTYLPIEYFDRINQLLRYFEGDLKQVIAEVLPRNLELPRGHYLDYDQSTEVEALRDADIIYSNWFSVIASYYKTAVAGDRPVITVGESEENIAEKEEYEEIFYDLYQAMDQALDNWAATDTQIYGATTDGENQAYIRSISPETYLAVTEYNDPTRLKGHILLNKYYKKIPEHQLTESPTPNRIRITKINLDGSIESDETYEYKGNSIGEKTDTDGDPYTNLQIFYVRTNNSLFPDIEYTVRQIIIRQSLLYKTLNDTAVPALAGPAIAASPQMLNVKVLPDGSSDEGPGWRWLEFPGNAQGQSDHLNNLYKELSYQSKVPGELFGEGLADDSSGVARAEARHAAALVISNLRRELERIIPKILNAAGIPGKIKVAWVTEPGATVAEMRQTFKEYYEMGAITTQELRDKLNLGPMPEELKQQEEANMQAMMNIGKQDQNNDNEEVDDGSTSEG